MAVCFVADVCGCSHSAFMKCVIDWALGMGWTCSPREWSRDNGH